MPESVPKPEPISPSTFYKRLGSAQPPSRTRSGIDHSRTLAVRPRPAPTRLAAMLLWKIRRWFRGAFGSRRSRASERSGLEYLETRENAELAPLALPAAVIRVPIRAATIKTELDRLVVGQIEAKEQLSLLLSMHSAWDSSLNPLHPPPNGIVIGPTGCGKTFSIEVACKYLRAPFQIIDSTSLVPSGATNGTPISEVIGKLVGIGRDGERSIVFLDEFDKIAVREEDRNKEWKRDVQRVLLKFIEGGLRDAAGGGPPLVLAGGAFVGIDGLDNRRKRRPEVERLLRSAPANTLVSDDIVNFGFIPEIVARLPAIIQYQSLSEKALLEILGHEVNSPLLIWQKHFAQQGKTLIFSDTFRTAVASRAAALQMGARGLQQIVFPALARRAYAFEDSRDDTIEVNEGILEYRKEE